MKLLKEGDRSRGICEACRKLVTTRFERRTMNLENPEVSVPDVLVAACVTCGRIVSVPCQSLPRLQQARRRAAPKVEARIPPILNDALGLISGTLSVRADEFGGMLIRYYLQRMGEDPATARRVKDLAGSSLATGKATGRISLRLAGPVWEGARRAARDAGLENKSDIFRGVIVAAAVDAGIVDELGQPPSQECRRAIKTLALGISDAVLATPPARGSARRATRTRTTRKAVAGPGKAPVGTKASG